MVVVVLPLVASICAHEASATSCGARASHHECQRPCVFAFIRRAVMNFECLRQVVWAYKAVACHLRADEETVCSCGRCVSLGSLRSFVYSSTVACVGWTTAAGSTVRVAAAVCRGQLAGLRVLHTSIRGLDRRGEQLHRLHRLANNRGEQHHERRCSGM